jgi:hypothetical protein
VSSASTFGAGAWFEMVWAESVAATSKKEVTIMGKLQGKVAVITGVFRHAFSIST